MEGVSEAASTASISAGLDPHLMDDVIAALRTTLRDYVAGETKRLGVPLADRARWALLASDALTNAMQDLARGALVCFAFGDRFPDESPASWAMAVLQRERIADAEMQVVL